jgi:serine/threonine-protein kinase
MTHPVPTSPCPSVAELVEIVEGRLDGPPLGRLKEHVAQCSVCAGVLDGLAPHEGLGPASATLDAGVARAIVEQAPASDAILGRGAAVGRYLVLSLLGRGGMGEVYAAYDPELDRRVALKILHTAGSAEQARRRLLREARALGKLSHPNVVVVHDVGEHHGDVFVAMELVEGQSLDAWCQGPPRPDWQEVLAAYRDAARGLAAAHAKGIVHRDVKPSNILRGKDGRVRVADFGLAVGRDAEETPASGPAGDVVAPDASGVQVRALADTVPLASDPDGDRGDLTDRSALVGTPLYMAPEQFEGPGVGPASDQHSLCTALHEGIYGTLPFEIAEGPGLLVQLVARKNEGPKAAPPPGSPVPAWVHRAIVRGLAPRPEDRFPSMDALADALREPPEPRRSRLRSVAIAAAAVAVATLAGVKSGAFTDPCAHPERQLAGAWDDGVRGRVRAALVGTGRSYAEDTAGRVAQILDRYTGSWAAMRGEVCQASRSGRQRRELAELRDACLDRRLGQVQALTGLLAEKPDADVLDKAVQAAAGLPPVASCADVEALTARVRPPEDPAVRAKVASIQPRIDRIEALYKAGRYKEGLKEGDAILADAGAAGYPPLRARAEFWVGELKKGAGDDEGAKALLRAATVSAAEGRDEDLSARAWADLLFVVGERQKRADEAAVVRALGPAAVARTGDAEVQAQWSSAEGLSLSRAGKHAEARAALERALELETKAMGPDHPDLAIMLGNLGIVVSNGGEAAEALPLLERAAAIRERSLGPDHPDTIRALHNLGIALANMGETARAVAVLERVVAARERSLGPEHPSVASTLNVLASALGRMHDHARAVVVARRALAIREKVLGPESPAVAGTLSFLGHALAEQGKLDEARSALERAVAVYEKAEGPSHTDLSEPLYFLGDLAMKRGKPGEAVPPLERALALHDVATEPGVKLFLADALWQIGKDRPRARALAEEARATYERQGDRAPEEQATRWLAEHPR